MLHRQANYPHNSPSNLCGPHTKSRHQVGTKLIHQFRPTGTQVSHYTHAASGGKHPAVQSAIHLQVCSLEAYYSALQKSRQYKDMNRVGNIHVSRTVSHSKDHLARKVVELGAINQRQLVKKASRQLLRRPILAIFQRSQHRLEQLDTAHHV